jgi:hypothetical protein
MPADTAFVENVPSSGSSYALRDVVGNSAGGIYALATYSNRTRLYRVSTDLSVWTSVSDIAYLGGPPYHSAA